MGTSDADVRICAKYLGIYGVSARTREMGVESVRTFFGQREERVNFVRTSFITYV